MAIKTGARKVGADTQVDLQLTDLAFENQGQSWLSLGALRIPSVLISKEAITMEPIEIEAPTLLLRRASQGEIEALALRFHPLEGAGEAANSEATTPKGAGPEGGGGLDLNLAGLQVHGVRVHWQDEAVEPAVDTSLRMEVGVQDLVLGSPASEPAMWFAQLGVDGSLENLRVGGELWLDPADLRSHTQVSMAGLRPGALAAYLPANMAMELQDGRLDWRVQANFTARSEGGHGLSVEAQDLVFREGEAGPKLLSLPRLALNVPILDPGGHRFDIQELSLKGLELPVRVDETGRLFGLGFSLDPGVESAVAEVEEEVPAPVVDDNIHAGGTDQVIVSKAEDRILPLVTLDGLDVGIERFSFVDERGGTPFDFRLHLIQEGPMTLLAPEAIDLPPLKFKVEGAANPVVDSIELDLELAPYAAEPTFDLQVLIAGVHGDQVTRVLPALADTLDGSAWTDGQLRAHVQGQLQMLRRGPLDFDLAQGFGLELAVDDAGVRATAEGPDLLGFEELTASVQSIRPDTGNVHVKRVEWVQPHGSAWQDEEGLHLAGWVLKMAQPVEQEGVAVAADDAAISEAEALVDADPEGVTPSDLEPEDGTNAGPPAEAAVEAPTEASAESGPEIRIDEALISGGTFLFEDRTVEPVLVFPIDDVDFQAKRFSTRTLEEERPFDFRLALYGAGIELPERTGSGNLIGGILGSVAALAGSDGVELEQRPVFDELTLRGKMSLGPLPKGWLQMRLRGFELPAIRGMAAQAGVGIGDGLMGESALLHMDGKGGLRISSHTHFSYLSLSEPLGGPISSFLKLPAPLDTVLFVLKDEDGDYSIPLYLSLDEGGASVSTIVAAITESFGLLIGDALASAPMRIVKGVVDLAGIDAEPIELSGDEWVDVPFGAGVVQAPGGMQAQVAPLLEMLRRDATLFLTVEHALGKDDVAQVWVLANPSRSECLELATFYRGRRSDLLRDRDDAAAEVRVAYALGQSEQARSRTAVLKGLDAELGQAESALDRVLERTRDQSERAQLRRTKTAALQVSRRRLARIEAILRSTKVPSIGTRINARRPRFSKSQAKSQGFIRISVERRR
ncbi:MAG: DUF748 domain-containing protein [bacterium]|nr:DUF748 domain-containing protein [bacterium]